MFRKFLDVFLFVSSFVFVWTKQKGFTLVFGFVPVPVM